MTEIYWAPEFEARLAEQEQATKRIKELRDVYWDAYFDWRHILRTHTPSPFPLDTQQSLV